MVTVYLVDNQTRVALPGSAWGDEVPAKLSELGHEVKMTDESPELLDRFADETARMHQLLAETKL